jgi:thymidylate kinase
MFYGFGNLFLYHYFQGVDIITDRHLASNYYWCGNNETDGFFKSLINIIGKPDFTILLHASVEESEKRIKKRSRFDPDLAKVGLHEEAKKKIKEFLDDYKMPHTVIDTTTLSPEEVLNKIMKSLPSSLINRINMRD